VSGEAIDANTAVLTVEAHHAKLLPESIVGGAGVDAHSGKVEIQNYVLEVGSLPHHVFPSEIAAAPCQYLGEQLRDGIVPRRVARVLDVVDADDRLAFSRPAGATTLPIEMLY
jgi:hypothetical protein